MWTKSVMPSPAASAILAATGPPRPLFPPWPLALTDPAERRVGPLLDRRLVLAVAPVAAGAVLMVVLPAWYADHGPYCAFPARVPGLLPRGYIGRMSEPEGLKAPRRRAGGTA